MPKGKKKIVDEVKEYIVGTGSPFSYWYVGVAENARDALFDAHGVSKESDLWIYRTARSSKIAHQIRDQFTSALGAEGSKEAAPGDPKMVYAYRMAAHTDP